MSLNFTKLNSSHREGILLIGAGCTSTSAGDDDDGSLKHLLNFTLYIAENM